MNNNKVIIHKYSGIYLINECVIKIRAMLKLTPY